MAKNFFFTTIGQYPTLYDFLAIAPKDIFHWEYYVAYPNICVKPDVFQPALLPASLYTGEVLHHMHDSGESPDVSVCHTISSMTSPSICPSHSLCVNTNMVPPGICLSISMSVVHSICRTISYIHSENTHEYSCMKFPECPIPGEFPFHLYIIGFIC